MNVVTITSQIEKPSTPTNHERPTDSTHGCFETIWKPACPVSKFASTPSETAKVRSVAASPTHRAASSEIERQIEPGEGRRPAKADGADHPRVEIIDVEGVPEGAGHRGLALRERDPSLSVARAVQEPGDADAGERHHERGGDERRRRRAGLALDEVAEHGLEERREPALGSEREPDAREQTSDREHDERGPHQRRSLVRVALVPPLARERREVQASDVPGGHE